MNPLVNPLIPVLRFGSSQSCVTATDKTLGHVAASGVAQQHVQTLMIELVRCRAVLTIQSIRRMLPVRRRFLRQRRAAVSLQAGERGRSARKDFKVLKQRHHAAIKVQVRALSIDAAIWPSPIILQVLSPGS